MDRSKWIRAAFSIAMAMLLSITSIACLLTAFDLNASVGTVLLWCMLWSLGFSIGYTLRWQLLPIGIMALLGGYLWQSGALYKSLNGLLFRLTDAYNLVHGWQVMGKRSNVDLILCTVGAVIALSVSAAVSGRKKCFFGVVFASVPILLCAPVANTAPDPLWLGLWMFGMGLLLMTQPVRKRSESLRLPALLAIPLSVLTVVLLLALPQNAQEKPVAFAQSVTQLLEDIGIGAAPGKAIKTDGGAVELNKLGSRKESGYLVMTVTADRGGTLYLRGCAYDTYFRNNWTNLALRDELYWPDESLLTSAGQVQIHTENAMDMRYFPYYVTDGSLENVNRGINNFSGAKDYAFSYGVLQTRPQTNTNRPDDGYSQLPTVTKRWADGVVQQLITEDMNDSQKLAAITGYVKNCAKYNLYVEKMPAEEQDFVIWFAEKAGKGYCVHFASTAAVLLRAAGLPSRYVTGYMVQLQAGVPTEVYGKNAHAWVECFVEGVGWVPVEATPGVEAAAAAENEPEQKRAVSVEPVLYVSAAVFGVTVLGFLTQAWVRVWLRGRKRRRGDPRARLLAGYGQLAQLLALLGDEPEQALQKTAERAKFSPHPVNEDDLKKIEQALKQAKKRLRKEPLMKKLHYRLILGLY